MSAPTLVLGTRNRKKRRELELLLRPLGIKLETLDEYSQAVEVEETGDTFAENAALKASQQATAVKRFVLGEDSGLCVDALDGAPGVYSARYAGPDATDEANNAKLIAALQDVPPQSRGGHYVCHMALANPDGKIILRCEATCRGRLRDQPAGSGGFGYDPLFEVIEYHRTFGELGDAVKSVLSHRARAMKQLQRSLTPSLLTPPD